MKNSFLLPFTAVAFSLAGCTASTRPDTAVAGAHWFIDVHEFGPGKVTAADVAKAHASDLAVQHKHDVYFVEYWLDEAHGNVYCLSKALDGASIVATHREAHGLLPAKIMPVSPGEAALGTPGAQRFLDIHELGAGKVTAEAVAAAHQKDLAVQSQHGVRFLSYWVDETSGTVLCLSEAKSAEAVRETHRAAHGLLPVSIVPVTQAR